MPPFAGGIAALDAAWSSMPPFASSIAALDAA
jgi:hypothetical protein